MTTLILNDPDAFSETLFEKMKQINPGISELELYEFRYGLNDLLPENGWGSVTLDDAKEIEFRLSRREFYDGIQIKPKMGDRIVLDEQIIRLAQMLFVGLVTGEYDLDWVKSHFYFDIRGFYFLHRTHYFTDKMLAHFGDKPYKHFEQKQKNFECKQDVGYKDFREANAEVDALFIESVKKIIAFRGTPILLAIAGPTAAGKTEIVERLSVAFRQAGQELHPSNWIISLPIGITGRQRAFIRKANKPCILNFSSKAWKTSRMGKRSSIPYYDTVFATSSHDLEGNLKPGSASQSRSNRPISFSSKAISPSYSRKLSI